MAAPNIYHSIYPDNYIPTELSIHQFLLAYNPDDVLEDKVILEDLDPNGGKVTYGGLRRDAAIGAGALVNKFNLKPGDGVVIYAGNSVNYALLAHSVMWFGGIVIGINPMVTAFELRHYLKVADAKMIVADPTIKSRVEEALSKMDISTKPQLLELGPSPEAFPGNFLKSASTAIPPFDLTGKDNRQHPAAVVFSSGTSGKPKGVHLSHYNMIAHAMSNRSAGPESANSSSREVFYAPFCHLFGLLGALLVPPYIGNYLVAMKQFNYKEWIDANVRIKATSMRMVPPTAVAISKDPNLENVDLSSVNTILCAGATLQTEVVQRLQYLLKGVSIIQGYGLSEAGVAGLRVLRSVDKAGSVGRLFPGNKLRIVNDELQDVKPGEPGEALIKGPTVFLGYRNDPKGTRDTFHDGWLRTGDVLKVDSDGFLWFQDRKKEMIKYKGNQVAPAELEDILSSHEHVVEAAVCATYDENQQTELPIGYVQLHPSIPEAERDAALKNILQWINGLVSPSKKLRGGLFYLASIPKNPTGKIMRSKLPAREEAARKALAKSRSAKL